MAICCRFSPGNFLLRTMTTSSYEHEFLNSFYIGINIENILYGKPSDTYYDAVQTNRSAT